VQYVYVASEGKNCEEDAVRERESRKEEMETIIGLR